MDPTNLATAQTLLHDKVQNRQRGIPTYYDNWIRRCIDYRGDDRATLAACETSLAEFLRVAQQPRLQHWTERHAVTRGKAALPMIALVHSQGVASMPQWKGLPMFKSAFDLMIYQQLLADLRPSHIVEIGSGSGASALWLRDLANAIYGEVQIVSGDITPPSLSEPSIEFMRCDCRVADGLSGVLTKIDRCGPVLVIEDAHEGMPHVIEQLHAWLKAGDYLILEDSQTKQAAIAASPLATTRDFSVDSHYVDLFGTNVTSCVDSIFVRQR